MFNTLSSSLGYVPRRNPAELGDKLFTQLDKSNKGYIEAADLQAAFAKVGATERKNGQGADAGQVFAQMDANGDGKLTRQEMTNGVVNIAKQMESEYNSFRAQGPEGTKPKPHEPSRGNSELASQLFSALDPQKRGYFEKSDLQAAFDKLDTSGTDTSKKVEELFAKLDTDSDGKVTSSEFAAQLSGVAGRPHPPEFSKDELNGMVEDIGKVDAKRAALLSDLVAHFDKADSDGNGKLSRKEAGEFLRANRPQGTEQPVSEARMISRMAIHAYSSSVSTMSQSVTVSA